jgi:DNA mismatch repair protein MutS
MSLTTSTVDRSKLTPMMQQYLEQKKKWPDCMLFFRLGDFYELFFEDAVTAARELELTLTGRDCGQDERAPMCGVPYHAVDNYIHRMIEKGYKIAICDQVEDPASAKGIVRRDVVRVITPGTVTDESMLEEKRNNYIVSLYRLNQYYGLAACDLTTGSFEATAILTGVTSSKLIDEIVRYDPSEILVNTAFEKDDLSKTIKERYNVMLTVRHDDDYSYDQIKKQLPDEVQKGQQPLWAHAAAALLVYLQETQRTRPGHLKPIDVYSLDQFMNLDPTARRNLELTRTIRDQEKRGTLLWAIDRTVTSVGGRMLRRWIEQPLLRVTDIKQRQDAVEAFKERYMIRQEIRECLEGLYDLERLASKLALGSANARDLLSLNQTLKKLPALSNRLAELDESWVKMLHNQIHDFSTLTGLLTSALVDDPPVSLKEGHLIRKGFDASIDRLNQASTNGKQWIIDYEASERKKTGIKSLKVSYNRVFGYYIEVTRTNLPLVPDHYTRKQTLANGERYITNELKDMEDTILGAEQKLIALEYEIFCTVRDEASKEIRALQETAEALATLDVLAALAELADREKYCKPVVDLSDHLVIRKGRHPVVERVLDPGGFVPNDIEMNMSDARLMILTGPNMSGKSTYMRQVALIVLMAQIGSFVPAESAGIGLVDRIFTRIGASDDLAGGASTFMVEMNEISHILKHATPRSLLVLDEIGRGTSTYDGLSIAWSVIEHIADRDNLGCRTLFATHYHELIGLAKQIPGVFNCHVSVSEKEGDIVFLHQIETGGCDDSYGIEVARLAGVPDWVVQRAHEILIQLEETHSSRDKAKIRRHARPMEGQIDLFKGVQDQKNIESIMNQLKKMDITQLTPLDALNTLNDLRQQAIREKERSS